MLLDGLYANGSVLDTCRQNGWKYIITFKEGSLQAMARRLAEALRNYLLPGEALDPAVRIRVRLDSS